MRKLDVAVAMLAALFSFNAQSAQVWKCKEGDRIVFSDLPCPTTGKPIHTRQLQGNVVQSEPAPDQSEESGGLSESAQRRDTANRDSAPPNSGNVCPGDLEIRNMETKASSITLGRREKSFLDDELRRARQCRKGQGNYQAADWQTSRDAQNAQSNLTARDAARRQAEGMHSAADPTEGDRIANRRVQEEAARIAAEAARRQRTADMTARTVSSCDANGCWTPSGRYTRTPGSTTFFGPGGACRLNSGQMVCP